MPIHIPNLSCRGSAWRGAYFLEKNLIILRTLSGQPLESVHGGTGQALDAFDRLRDSSRQLREALAETRDGTLRYVRDEPVKTVTIVAAAGIVVLGFVILLAQLRDRR